MSWRVLQIHWLAHFDIHQKYFKIFKYIGENIVKILFWYMEKLEGIADPVVAHFDIHRRAFRWAILRSEKIGRNKQIYVIIDSENDKAD